MMEIQLQLEGAVEAQEELHSGRDGGSLEIFRGRGTHKVLQKLVEEARYCVC